MNTQTIVTWPTGNAYPGERWRVVKLIHDDVVIQNVEGFRATVHQLTVEVVN